MARKRPARKAARSKKSSNFCPCAIVPLLGFALIVAKATDYLTGCDKVPVWVVIVGLLLLVAGKLIMKKCGCGK